MSSCEVQCGQGVGCACVSGGVWTGVRGRPATVLRPGCPWGRAKVVVVRVCVAVCACRAWESVRMGTSVRACVHVCACGCWDPCCGPQSRTSMSEGVSYAPVCVHVHAHGPLVHTEIEEYRLNPPPPKPLSR